MKIVIALLFTCVLSSSVFGAFRTWTRNDGKTAELELVSVSESDGEKSGKFKMRNGRMVTLKASTLSDEDAKLIAEWKPAAEAVAEPAEESVFDEILDRNLLRLKGKSLKSCKDATKPKKYYVFYYTASWCPPCQKFTPSLVEFYNEHKNDNFEIVLISSDRNEDNMEQYAEAKEMPWPQLKLKKVKTFKKKFNHGVGGIPSVIVCDLDGKNLGNYRDLSALEKLVK